MSTRREFLIKAAASVVAAASVPVTRAAKDAATVSQTGSGVSRIKSAIRREDTILRLGGNGDDYLMTWAADDRQFVAVQDGAGWFKNPKGQYNSRLWTITGGPQDATFQDIPGYPDLMNVWHTQDIARYYSFGTLALDGYIYQFLCTPAGPINSGAAGWIGAKLIYSPDNGSNWHNQDGSTPVVWESWQSRSRENMVFFKESQDAFSLLSILQMGRNYEANRDGYVYVYSPNGNVDGAMNQLVMFRVPKAHILNRGAYEYFSGFRPDGDVTWNKDIEARAPVHTFARGWVSTPYPYPVESWLPNVVYNVPLGLYVMVSWGAGCAPDGSPFSKPSYLGFWAALHPWGPWTQIYEDTEWTPGRDPAARCYAPQIAPKWIAADGKSFWLVWTDYQQKHTDECRKAWGELERALLPDPGRRATSHDAERRLLSTLGQCQPYYAFNTQRVDLIFE